MVPTTFSESSQVRLSGNTLRDTTRVHLLGDFKSFQTDNKGEPSDHPIKQTSHMEKDPSRCCNFYRADLPFKNDRETITLRSTSVGAGEMAQRSWVLASLPDDPSFLLSTSVRWFTVQFQGIQFLLLVSTHTHMHSHTHTHITHVHPHHTTHTNTHTTPDTHIHIVNHTRITHRHIHTQRKRNKSFQNDPLVLLISVIVWCTKWSAFGNTKSFYN